MNLNTFMSKQTQLSFIEKLSPDSTMCTNLPASACLFSSSSLPIIEKTTARGNGGPITATQIHEPKQDTFSYHHEGHIWTHKLGGRIASSNVQPSPPVRKHNSLRYSTPR